MLAAGFGQLLSRVAPELNPPEAKGFAEGLVALDAQLRNPPVDLEAVRADERRPSVGEKWSRYPEDVLPLWVADMDFPIAEPIRRVLRGAVERSDLGYPNHPAPTGVRELAVERMRARIGSGLTPSCTTGRSSVSAGMGGIGGSGFARRTDSVRKSHTSRIRSRDR